MSRRSFIHDVDGRIRGSYVYMLLCRDGDGPIYVKIGVSNSPLERFKQLKNNCAVTPRRLLFVAVMSRDIALRLEADLLDSFSQWKTAGEWVKVSLADKQDFNRLWQEAFKRHARKGRPLSWTQIPAENLIKGGNRRLAHFRKLRYRRGAAFRDFVRDSTATG